MGELIKQYVQHLRPTQNYLIQETIDYYKKNSFLLSHVPIPVIRDICYDSEFALLDGHHHTAYAYLKNSSGLLWLTESEKDFIPYDSFSNISKECIDACNEQIKKRYWEAMFYMPSDKNGSDIKSIKELIYYSGINLK